MSSPPTITVALSEGGTYEVTRNGSTSTFKDPADALRDVAKLMGVELPAAADKDEDRAFKAATKKLRTTVRQQLDDAKSLSVGIHLLGEEGKHRVLGAVAMGETILKIVERA